MGYNIPHITETQRRFIPPFACALENHLFENLRSTASTTIHPLSHFSHPFLQQTPQLSDKPMTPPLLLLALLLALLRSLLRRLLLLLLLSLLLSHLLHNLLLLDQERTENAMRETTE